MSLLAALKVPLRQTERKWKGPSKAFGNGHDRPGTPLRRRAPRHDWGFVIPSYKLLRLFRKKGPVSDLNRWYFKPFLSSHHITKHSVVDAAVSCIPRFDCGSFYIKSCISKNKILRQQVGCLTATNIGSNGRYPSHYENNEENRKNTDDFDIVIAS